MAVSKFVLLTVVIAVFLSTVAAQFGGLYDIGFGFGGKPFGKPGFGGLGGGKPGFGGLGGLGGLGGKPGKPGFGLGGLGGLGDLYRYNSPEDTGAPYYNWESAPNNN